MIKKVIMFMMLCFILNLGGGNLYAKGNVQIVNLGDQGSSYTLNFTGTEAMISRDGSMAMPITNGVCITLPGTYYVSIKKGGELEIQMFKIGRQKIPSTWIIKEENELDEVLKYALENYETQIYLSFDYGSFQITEMKKVIQDHIQNVLMTYPGLTYDGGMIEQKGNDKPMVSLTLNYPLANIAACKNYDQQSKQALNQLISQTLTSNMTAFEREKAIGMALIGQISYSKQLVNHEYVTNATPITHTIWGGMVNHSAVCDGYSRSFMYAMNMVGVPTQMITGVANGENHAWNLVKLEDDYYHVDLTWADSEGTIVNPIPDYFNEMDSYMQQTHQWDTTAYPRATASKYCMAFAALSGTGTYKASNPAQLKQIFKQIEDEKLSSGTLILYDASRNAWEAEEMAEQLTDILEQGIYYLVENKYDMLIITYEVR